MEAAAGFTGRHCERENVLTVCDPDRFDGTGYQFSYDCRGVVSAWSSGVFSLNNPAPHALGPAR